MMRYLEFMFSGPFVFLGMIMLIAITLGGIADIVKAFKK